MPIPAGYTQLTTGFWRKDSDLSGPYAWTGAAFYLISTGVAGSGVAADYTQHPSGFWFKTADGSGPYSYDGTDFWLAGNGGPSGAITVATVNVSSAINMANGSTFNLYNTADQTTNYERLRADWSGGTARIFTQFGGSASARVLRVGTSATSGGANPDLAYLQIAASTGAPFALVAGSSNSTTAVGVDLISQTYTASAGTQIAARISPAINQSGTAGYTAFDINPTETATGSGTKLLQRWAVGGTAKAQVDSGGLFYGSTFAATTALAFSTSIGGTGDVTLARDAADTLALRRSTNAQTFRVYNTYTDGSNGEYLQCAWSGNIAYVRTMAQGTGVSRSFVIGTFGASSLYFQTNSVTKWEVSSSGHFLTIADNTYDIGASGANRPRNLYIGGSASFGQYYGSAIAFTVATLSAAGLVSRARAFVSDSTVAAAGNFGAIVAGGGANIVPVYSDGTNWRIG